MSRGCVLPQVSLVLVSFLCVSLTGSLGLPVTIPGGVSDTSPDAGRADVIDAGPIDDTALRLAAGTVDETAAALGVHPNELRYLNWRSDADGDGIDDDLQHFADPGELVWLYAHFGHRPGGKDVAALEAAGATRSYLFDHFDTVKVEAPAAAIPLLRTTPGVVALEEFHMAWQDNNVGRMTIRADADPEGTIADGFDHTLSVHTSLGFRGEGMVVAILDSGVRNDHESLDDLDDDPDTDDPKLLQKVVDGETIFGGARLEGFLAEECVDPIDDNGHGTHVAGTAVGTGGPSGTYRGVAPAARLVDLQISSAEPFSPAYDLAMDWLISFNAGTTCYGDPGDDRIDVAGMSYSIGTDDPADFTNRQMDKVVESGITFTVSAGNAGDGPETLTKGSDGIIYVASDYDKGTVARGDDELSDFSSRGPRPADGDAETHDEMRPDVAAPGQAITSAYYLPGPVFNQYVSNSGTSMSQPHVAGLAALVLQAGDSVGNDLRPVPDGPGDDMGGDDDVPVRHILRVTAQYREETIGEPPQVTAMGVAGRPWNNAWGYGLVDAYSAVLMALGSGLDAAPVACFEPTLVGAMLSVDASCSSDAEGPIASYAWDFAGEATASGATASHEFSADGVYGVSLTVTDSAAQTSSTVQVLTVGDPFGAYEALANGETVTVAAPSSAFPMYYRFDAPGPDGDLEVATTGDPCAVAVCAGPDLDLYIRHQAVPTTGSYDCRGYTTSNDESCVITGAADGTWIIMLDLYSNTIGQEPIQYEITAAWTGPPGPVGPVEGAWALANGVPARGDVRLAEPSDLWYVEVPDGATILEVTLDGLTCDAGRTCVPDIDLRVQHGAPAAELLGLGGPWVSLQASQDCAGTTSGADETCSIEDPAPGLWYITVDYYANKRVKVAYELTATYS